MNDVKQCPALLNPGPDLPVYGQGDQCYARSLTDQWSRRLNAGFNYKASALAINIARRHPRSENWKGTTGLP